MPTRELVLFPRMVAPIFVGRERSISAIEAAFTGQTALILCAQREAAVEEPSFDDLRPVGVRARVLQLFKLPDGSVKAIVEGDERVRTERLVASDPHFLVSYAPVESTGVGTARARSLARRVTDEFVRYVRLHPQLADEAQFVVQQAADADELADIVAAHLQTETGGEAGAARDREHAAAPPRPAGEPRRGERRARHRAGDRAQGAAAHRGRAAPAAAAREAARAARRDRGGRRGRRRGPGRVRGARRRGRALAGGAQARDARAHQAPAGSAHEPRGRRHPRLPRHGARAPLGQAGAGRRGRARGSPSPRAHPRRPQGRQGPHPRVPRRVPPARRRGPEGRRPGGERRRPAGHHPLPRRPARHRQEQRRPEHRRRAGPAVRAGRPGRRARRGGDPRASPHVHRGDARAASSTASPRPASTTP